MAGRTVAEKMGVVPGCRALLVDAPASAVAAMQLPPLDLGEGPAGSVEHLHLFVTTRADLRRRLPELEPHLAPGGRLWVSWPRGGRLGTDLALPSVIATSYDAGLVESTCLRVDETWAALKLTRPRPGKRYANSYGTLPDQRGLSAEG